MTLSNSNNNKALNLSQLLKAIKNDMKQLSSATFLIKERNASIKYSKTQHMIQIDGVRTLYVSKEAFYQMKTLLHSLVASVKCATELSNEVTALQKENATLLEGLQSSEQNVATLEQCQEVRKEITLLLKAMLGKQALLNNATINQDWKEVAKYAAELEELQEDLAMWEDMIADLEATL